MSKIAAYVIAVAVVAAGVWAFAARSFAAETMPTAGQMAPNFTLPNEEGKPVSLQSLRGQWVVLYFYPKDMSSGCTIEAHNFQRDSAQFAQYHAVVVGVSVDSVNSHRTFCAKDNLGFTLLSDYHKKVSKEYGSIGNYGIVQLSKRNTFLIDPHGKIVKVWTSVNPNTASQDVLGELKLLERPATPASGQ